VAAFTSKLSEVFQSTQYHLTPNYLAKKKKPGMAVFKQLAFST